MIGTPGFNAHAPGPIGDTTPSTLAGTTLNLTTTSTQLQLYYDGTHRNEIFTNSAGQLVFNQVDNASFKFTYQGSTNILTFGSNLLNLGLAFGCFQVGDNTLNADRVMLSVYSSPGLSGTGIGNGGVAQTVAIVTNDTDRVLISNTAMTLKSGISLIVGTQTPASAAATGVAGTIAWDASFLYVATGTNTWKRVAISTW